MKLQALHLQFNSDLKSTFLKAIHPPISKAPDIMTAANANDWTAVKATGDIIEIANYRTSHPDSPMRDDIDRTYDDLREAELANMRANPADYERSQLKALFNAGVFSLSELIGLGLLTEKSWAKLGSDIHNRMPYLKELQIPDPNLQAPEGCSDIYFCGQLASGTTSIIGSLAAVDGMDGFRVNTLSPGGRYAAALRQYANEGVPASRTIYPFTTFITCALTNVGKRGNKEVKFNLVEVSNQEFIFKIADSSTVKIGAIRDSVVASLMANSNRKVIFLLIDPTRAQVSFDWSEMIRDEMGACVDYRKQVKYVSALDSLCRFIDKLAAPENEGILERIDAINFIVTKAETLGDRDTRNQAAADLLESRYRSLVEKVRDLCRHSRHINASTDYEPVVYTFSLGPTYLGGLYDFDTTDTLHLIDSVRDIIDNSVALPWWRRIGYQIRTANPFARSSSADD